MQMLLALQVWFDAEIKLVVQVPTDFLIGPAIFAMEPHDVLPLSIFSFNDCLGAVKNHKVH